MANVSEEYQKYVLDDIRNYDGLYSFVKSSFWERHIVRSVDINKLHPNPNDEFCKESVGPSYEIIGKYASHLQLCLKYNRSIDTDPLIVEKISTGGYMILNGHHRWMAYHRVGIRRIPIEIINVTPDEDILEKIRKSEHDVCVSFDLDEVLLTDEASDQSGSVRQTYFSRKNGKRIRRNTGQLISKLHSAGMDVWVYCADFYSEKYIKRFFSLNGTYLNGIINGLGRRSASGNNLKSEFSRNYKYLIHVDAHNMTVVNTDTKDYDLISIDTDRHDWAAGVYTSISNLDCLK